MEDIGKAPLRVLSVTNTPLGKTAAGVSAALACRSTGTVTVVLGNGQLSFKISLDWCWDGNVVSNWGGQCSGSVSTWARVNFWYFAGCTTNDFIPYRLNGRYPGGVHHYAVGLFQNSIPWTYSVDQAISIWGHFDGTWNYQAH